MDVENSEAQLYTAGEYLDYGSTNGDDPAPSTLRVIVLTERGRFRVEAF